MSLFTPTDIQSMTSEQWLAAIGVALVWGFTCMYFAKKKGRDPKGWFILGLLFSIFAFGALMLIPSERQMQLAAEAKAIEEKKQLALIEEQKQANAFQTTLESRQWYYLDPSHKQIGPITLEDLKQEKSKDNIHGHTYLWSEGMLDWKQLDDLSYLKTELE